jgi:hypothetical protein
MRVGALDADIAFEEEPAAPQDLGLRIADVIPGQRSYPIIHRAPRPLRRDQLKIHEGPDGQPVLDKPGRFGIEREGEIVTRVQAKIQLCDISPYYDIPFLYLGLRKEGAAAGKHQRDRQCFHILAFTGSPKFSCPWPASTRKDKSLSLWPEFCNRGFFLCFRVIILPFSTLIKNSLL